MYPIEFLDRSVTRFNNEYNDEMEMEIIKFYDHYKIVATICQEDASYNDFIGVGTDRRSGRKAARKALSYIDMPIHRLLNQMK
jgi:hypothetical protein